jgi:hypothetical protein
MLPAPLVDEGKLGQFVDVGRSRGRTYTQWRGKIGKVVAGWPTTQRISGMSLLRCFGVSCGEAKLL